MFVEAVANLQPCDLPCIAQENRSANLAGDLLRAMRELSRLPLASLTPAEVIEQQLAGSSMDDLRRALEEGRLCGGRDARTQTLEFPAWQFVEPAPSLMPPIMRALHGAACVDPRYFWTTRYEELCDLTPAELLCGKLFVSRRRISIEQADYLSRSDQERQWIVAGHHNALVAERDGTRP
jgi:hypothetical protein